MKIFKKIAAAGAALMMAVTGMAMSASATSSSTWLVRRNVNAPQSWNIPDETDLLSKSSTVVGFYDRCLNFTQYTYQGTMSTVTVQAYIGAFNNPTAILHVSTYTAKTPSGDNGYKAFPISVSANTVIYIKHYITFNGLPCNMDGDTYL